MTSVFISYSRKNINYAKRIVAELQARGADVFIDYDINKSGFFTAHLGSEIIRCEYFIVLLTEAALKSKWVVPEVVWAYDKKELDKIIPVKIEACDLKNLFVLAALQQVDFSDWIEDSMNSEPIHALARLLKLPTMPIQDVIILEPAEEIDEYDVFEEEVEEEEEQEEAPKFTSPELITLITRAASFRDAEPERSVLLYRLVSEQLRGIIEELDNQLVPQRVNQLRSEAMLALKQDDWGTAKSLLEKIETLSQKQKYKDLGT